MKTSAELQQQSFLRKTIYFGLIIVLFSVLTFAGRIGSIFGRGPSKWSVTNQAKALQLNESDQGEADLAGSTIRLALSGSRGFALSMMWLGAIEKQKRHEWDDVELLVSTITKLQPHFLTPWLFQSWNLAYNVSVESDRVRDKYFYISRGIELLADGERINRARGIDSKTGEEYTVGNPDMRFWTGFYYSNKFGVSDEQNTLRSLLQLSCINPEKRDANQLRPDGRNVDLEKYREFVEQNPLLARRLRDFVRCDTPGDVVDFLKDSSRVPSRYEEVDGRWRLRRRAQGQFPILPADFPPTAERASPYQEFGGDFDSFHCAWAWHVFAQEPLPRPEEPGMPSAGVQDFDRLRYRKPRQPAEIIFRQQPARSLSYIAERLQKEGWFDESGWEVDRGQTTDLWFPDQTVIVGSDPRFSSHSAWQAAFRGWEDHGKEHGFLLSIQDRRNLSQQAELFRSTYSDYVSAAATITKDRVSPEMWQSFKAERALKDLEVNQQMTNFRHHLYRAEAESDDRTVQMRRAFYEAERLRRLGLSEPAIRKYREAFVALIGDESAGKEGLLDKYPEFRRDSTIQDDLIEKNLDYLILLDSHQGPAMRSLITSQNLVSAVLTEGGPTRIFASLLYQFAPRPRELPTLFVGPLEGRDSRDDPWVSPSAIESQKQRKGLIAAPRDIPVAPGGGALPSRE